MVLLQQMEKLNLSTFGNASKHLLKRILPSVNGTTYFVTDQYLPGSIKTLERSRRSESGSLRFKVERRDQARPKQWSKFLKDPSNKSELIQFLLNDWSDPARFKKLLKDRFVFVNVDSKFYKLTSSSVEVMLSILRTARKKKFHNSYYFN